MLFWLGIKFSDLFDAHDEIAVDVKDKFTRTLNTCMQDAYWDFISIYAMPDVHH